MAVLAAALALATLGFTGVAAQDGGDQSLTIGAAYPLTGDLAVFGTSGQNAVQLAVNDINQAGGVWGQDAEVVFEDTETSQTAAPQAVSRLLNVENVDVMTGAYSSGVTLSFLDQVVNAGVPICSPANTAPTFTTFADNGLYHRVVPSDALQGKVMAQLASQEGYQDVGILAINNDYGVGFAEEFEAAFNGTVTNLVRYDPEGTTFETDVQQAAQGNPDAIILVGYPDTGTQIMQTAFEQGITEQTPFLFSEGVFSQSFVNDVGNTTEGQPILAGFKGTTPEVLLAEEFEEEFQQRYRQEFNSNPELFAPQAYDCVAGLALAAEMAGPGASGEEIAAAVQDVYNAPGENVTDLQQALQLVRNGTDIDWNGPAGTFELSDAGDPQTGTYAIWEVADNGTIQITDTGIQVAQGPPGEAPAVPSGNATGDITNDTNATAANES